MAKARFIRRLALERRSRRATCARRPEFSRGHTRFREPLFRATGGGERSAFRRRIRHVRIHATALRGLRGLAATVEETADGFLMDAGVANVGNRPTVDGGREFLEAHLFDGEADLYERNCG